MAGVIREKWIWGFNVEALDKFLYYGILFSALILGAIFLFVIFGFIYLKITKWKRGKMPRRIESVKTIAKNSAMWNGHDMTKFKEIGNRWKSYCKDCNAGMDVDSSGARYFGSAVNDKCPGGNNGKESWNWMGRFSQRRRMATPNVHTLREPHDPINRVFSTRRQNLGHDFVM